jgi:hypothetical protein
MIIGLKPYHEDAFVTFAQCPSLTKPHAPALTKGSHGTLQEAYEEIHNLESTQFGIIVIMEQTEQEQEVP